MELAYRTPVNHFYVTMLISLLIHIPIKHEITVNIAITIKRRD